jgi:hypothetical protein
MEEALVPLYLYHRYAVQSAASMVAGQDFVYSFRGDDRVPTKWVSATQQKAAIDALVFTLKPSELALPKAAIMKIPPRPSGWGLHRELFARHTGDAFDPVSPAAIAAEVTIGFVLQPDRAARMVVQHSLDPTLPGLDDVIKALRAATFTAPAATPYEQEIRRATSRVLAEQLMALAASASMPQVRAIASSALASIQENPGTVFGMTPSSPDRMAAGLMSRDIKRFLERPMAPVTTPAMPDAPPGAPIGDPGMNWLARPAWSCGWIQD